MSTLDGISDEELAELAMVVAQIELGPDAKEWPGAGAELMPEWYMGSIRGRATGWRKAVVLGLVGWLGLITLLGICVTTGLVSLG